MNSSKRNVNTLFITNNRQRARVLQDLMADHGVTGALQRLSPDAGTATRVRRRAVDRSERRPDLVLIDFADVTPATRKLVQDLALGHSRLRVPVVILTSSESEQLLQSGALDENKAVMFESNDLRHFVANLADQRRKRYLWSLSVLYQYGPILLRSIDCDAKREEQLLAVAS